MNKEPTVDKVYLALELTRMCVNENTDTSCVWDKFNFFLTELTGIENISKMKEIQTKLEYYRELYNNLNNSVSAEVEHRTTELRLELLSYIKDHSGDMEPVVYTTLLQILENCTQ